MKLTYLKGLPASGKTTWAKEQVAKSKGKTKRVNKDDLRSMLDNGEWSKTNEKQVVSAERTLVHDLLRNGYSVIVDNTGFSKAHEDHYRELAKQFNAEFEVKFFDTDLKECIQRDLKRENSVGEKVIRQMHTQFIAKPVQYMPPEGEPWAVICDIDGTLAHATDRSPYDFSKLSEDTVDTVVNELLDAWDSEIILCTGREEKWRENTEKWLTEHDVRWDALFMRPTGDKREDSIIKQEIFDNHIRNEYRVICVFDDRNRVVDMWRANGLKCLQVAEGDF